MEKREEQIEIDLSREVAQGTYANLAIIAHSASEFIIDFVCLLPGGVKPEVKSRIIMTPENAKRLMYALKGNIGRYEEDHGEIYVPAESVQESIERLFPVDLKPKGQA